LIFRAGTRIADDAFSLLVASTFLNLREIPANLLSPASICGTPGSDAAGDRGYRGHAEAEKRKGGHSCAIRVKLEEQKTCAIFPPGQPMACSNPCGS
jgi:hypothetical protein